MALGHLSCHNRFVCRKVPITSERCWRGPTVEPESTLPVHPSRFYAATYQPASTGSALAGRDSGSSVWPNDRLDVENRHPRIWIGEALGHGLAKDELQILPPALQMPIDRTQRALTTELQQFNPSCFFYEPD